LKLAEFRACIDKVPVLAVMEREESGLGAHTKAQLQKSCLTFSKLYHKIGLEAEVKSPVSAVFLLRLVESFTQGSYLLFDRSLSKK
jgi:hypothetical protein